MRLAPRLFRRPAACLAPATPSDLIERGLEAVREVVEAAAVTIEAAPRPHRGRNTAVTVAAVTATALVATAAYVWWKRRDRVASMDVAFSAVPPMAEPTAVEPIVASGAPAAVIAEERPTLEPKRVAPAVTQASRVRRSTSGDATTVGDRQHLALRSPACDERSLRDARRARHRPAR